jgi:uroporphyrinogen-III synthase
LSTEETAFAVARERAARPGHRPPQASLHGCRVLTLESRRAPELALLIVNYGGRPMVAPALREVPLDASDGAVAFGEALISNEYDLVVMTTGIGTRLFMKLVAPSLDHARIVDALLRLRIVARGPKPVAALRELDITPWLTAPSPNTWKEVIAVLDGKAPGACAGARIAVQEYGAANLELVAALQQRGAAVTSVPIYRWELPEDVEPLRAAVDAIVAGDVDIILLTASVQLLHLLDIAATMNLSAEIKSGLRRLIIASIGPMTSEELRRQELQIDLEPSHPKMGFLVKEVAERCAPMLRAKRLPGR